MEDELIKKTFKEMKKRLPKADRCLDEDDLTRYVEGIMDEEEAKRIKEHLIQCPKCCDAAVSLTVALNKVDTLSVKSALPEASEKQIRRASALVSDRNKYKREYSLTESISSNLERITQSIRDFFSFGWVMQPIPVAVKSGVVAFLIILIVSTTYLYYQREGKMISEEGTTIPFLLQMDVIGRTKVASERGIPGVETIEKIIKEGDTLYSDDHFRVELKINKDAYVYVVFYDSSGKLQQLYPDPNIEDLKKTKANIKYSIPQEESKWFKLDKNIGKETVFILASNEPISNLQELFDSTKGLKEKQFLKEFENRGITVTTRSFNHK